MQQSNAQSGLKRRKPAADRGLRDPEFTRCRGKAAIPDY
jgi:hypothetical protein